MHRLLSALLVLVSPAGALAQVSGDVELAPVPSELSAVAPPDGATVPANAVLFAESQSWGVPLTARVEHADLDEQVLSSQDLGCLAGCLARFDHPLWPAPLAGLIVDVGLELDLPSSLTYEVTDVEDTEPPTFSAAPTLTARFAAYNGELIGYDVTVHIEPATDDFGVGAYLVRADHATEELADSGGRVHTGAALDVPLFASPEKETVCAEVTVVDWAGKPTLADRACVDLVPPTDAELAATLLPLGGCRCLGGETTALGGGLAALLVLPLFARRRRR